MMVDDDYCRCLALALSTVTLLTVEQDGLFQYLLQVLSDKGALSLLLHFVAQIPEECNDNRVGIDRPCHLVSVPRSVCRVQLSTAPGARGGCVASLQWSGNVSHVVCGILRSSSQ